MFYTAFAMLVNNLFIMLRLGGAGGSFPRTLTAAEEKEYVNRWVEKGDVQARNELIEHNLRLVAHIVKKYYSLTADQDDLISIGTIGLIKGISTFRPEKNARLATYASRCIENEILMYFRSTKKSAGDLSLSDSIDSDGEGNSLSILDVIADEEDMFENLSAGEMSTNVRRYVDTILDEREVKIIYLRYGLGGEEPLTQRETADKCGISRSYVSRIEKRALSKLREALEE